jgi:hypothetical protein
VVLAALGHSRMCSRQIRYREMGACGNRLRWVGLASAILRTNYHKICENMKMGGVYNSYLTFRLSPMSDSTSLQLSFIQLLRLTRQSQVTDKRDRVYGLLGNKTKDNESSGGELFIEPDYSISDSELWKRLTCKIIHDTQGLFLLSSVQYVYVSKSPLPKIVGQGVQGFQPLGLCVAIDCDLCSIFSFQINA